MEKKLEHEMDVREYIPNPKLSAFEQGERAEAGRQGRSGAKSPPALRRSSSPAGSCGLCGGSGRSLANSPGPPTTFSALGGPVKAFSPKVATASQDPFNPFFWDLYLFFRVFFQKASILPNVQCLPRLPGAPAPRCGLKAFARA